MVATTSLVINVNRKITSATRECTTDNRAYSVFCAWLRSCLFHLQLKAVFGLSVPRSMDMTGAVTSANVKSHSCQFLPLGPSEGHSWLDKIQHVGWTLHLISVAAASVQHTSEIFGIIGLAYPCGLKRAYSTAVLNNSSALGCCYVDVMSNK